MVPIPIPTVSCAVTCGGHTARGVRSSVIRRTCGASFQAPPCAAGRLRSRTAHRRPASSERGWPRAQHPAAWAIMDRGHLRAGSPGQRTARTMSQTPASMGSMWCPRRCPEYPFLRVRCARSRVEVQVLTAGKGRQRPRNAHLCKVSESLDMFGVFLPAFKSNSPQCNRSRDHGQEAGQRGGYFGVTQTDQTAP